MIYVGLLQFCLLRVWAPTASLGANLATFSRRYFFTGALIAFVIASAYSWAQFPFDNVCDPRNGTITPANELLEDVRLFNGTTTDLTLGQLEPVQYCAQGFR